LREPCFISVTAQIQIGSIRIRFEKYSPHAFEKCFTFVLMMTKICISCFSRCRFHLDPNGGVKSGCCQVLIRCPACLRAAKMNFWILRSPCALCTVICSKSRWQRESNQQGQFNADDRTVSRFFNPRQNGARGARGRLGREALDSSDCVSLSRAVSDRPDVVHSSDTRREIERSKS
jgi:hypothetical protein